MKLPTDEQIEIAKKEIILPIDIEAHHEHLDCIRIAYAWLDTQKTIQTPSTIPTKMRIRSWGLRFISYSDIYIAAHLHPDIKSSGRKLNISRKYIKPLTSRLLTIGEAGKHPNYFNKDIKYAVEEKSE